MGWMANGDLSRFGNGIYTFSNNNYASSGYYKTGEWNLVFFAKDREGDIKTGLKSFTVS
tara:strand:+ start:342 stop:518 length:177 start_codon:yes stop_codon:yes gene_type:complete